MPLMTPWALPLYCRRTSSIFGNGSIYGDNTFEVVTMDKQA
jgi:hypothetical protein